MDFHLNCWIPSLSGYTRIRELKNNQLYVLSKYILNEDHEGTNLCFNKIIKNNLLDKEIYGKLTRFDKWFILAFYRATNISPVVYIQTTTKDKAPCNVELQLFDTLTKLSEINLTFNTSLEIEDLTLQINASSDLYSKDGYDAVKSITIKNTGTRIEPPVLNTILLENKNLSLYVKKYLTNIDLSRGLMLLENKNPDIILNNIPFRLYDNTLFFFIRSIYLPFCKGVYTRQYNLMRKLGIDYNSVQSLTPLEGEIFINLYNEEENEKKSKKSIDIR